MNEIPIARNLPQPSSREYPLPVRLLAQFFSYLFHPLFISTYMMAFLMFVHPYAYTGFLHQEKMFRFLHILIMNAFFPAFAVFLLWRLEFIRSIYLRTAKERIIPYLIAMIFYWWTWNVFKNKDNPSMAVHFLCGSFVAVCGAWMFNIYYKISMHAIATGSAMMFFFLFSAQDDYASGLYLSLAVLVTGIVCTSRLIGSDHTRFEVWSGLFVGILAQWMGWWF
ncbi:MAG TPA: hypothetical protein VK563_21350 [Puia sp.]|nr:hypothetical protein [Puia sp.]